MVESARCLQPITRVGHSVPIVFLDVLLLRRIPSYTNRETKIGPCFGKPKKNSCEFVFER